MPQEPEYPKLDAIRESLTAVMKAQADALPDGWVEIEIPECEDTKAPAFTVKLPRIPFERWARHTYRHRFDEWERVCHVGIKMQGDDPNHSDWWLGTGLPLEYAYGRKPATYNSWLEPDDEDYIPPRPNEDELVALSKRVLDHMWSVKFDMTEKRERNSIFLVSTKKEIEGLVYHVRSPADIEAFVDDAVRWKKSFSKQKVIAVVPNCSIEYDQVIRHAGAIITEIGSAAAHLVKVAREDKIPVIMCPNAFKEYFFYERIRIKDKNILALQ